MSVLISLVLAGGSLPLPQTEAHNYNTITWGPCSESLPAPRLQCANFSVPLDLNHPEGEKIVLGMAKLPAQDPENRIGNLFINPGGPGYSAANEVPDIGLGTNGYTGDEIKRSFDIIVLDPGALVSAPVCSAALTSGTSEYRYS